MAFQFISAADATGFLGRFIAFYGRMLSENSDVPSVLTGVCRDSQFLAAEFYRVLAVNWCIRHGLPGFA